MGSGAQMGLGAMAASAHVGAPCPSMYTPSMKSLVVALPLAMPTLGWPLSHLGKACAHAMSPPPPTSYPKVRPALRLLS